MRTVRNVRTVLIALGHLGTLAIAYANNNATIETAHCEMF